MLPVLRLISLDIGGTIGTAEGPSIVTLLADASPLTPSEVRRILRESLYVVSSLSPERIALICRALEIDPSEFPDGHTPPPFRLYVDAAMAIKALSRFAPVVTLSNVCCLDYDALDMEKALGSRVLAQYPSCVLGYSKPDGRAFRAVAARHGVASCSVLHIGDDWECDVVGALETGAHAFWISRGRTAPRSDVPHPERLTIVQDLPEAAVKLQEMVAGTS